MAIQQHLSAKTIRAPSDSIPSIGGVRYATPNQNAAATIEEPAMASIPERRARRQAEASASVRSALFSPLSLMIGPIPDQSLGW